MKQFIYELLIQTLASVLSDLAQLIVKWLITFPWHQLMPLLAGLQ